MGVEQVDLFGSISLTPTLAMKLMIERMDYA